VSEIWSAYNLTNSHFELRGFAKGMYGLKKAAVLAYKQLCEHLPPFRYAPVTHTPGLWYQHAIQILFPLSSSLSNMAKSAFTLDK
jgi:hypothetical protein